MKKVFLTLLLTLLSVGYASAQRSQTVSLRVGEQKTLARHLKIRFVEVAEDSRCPKNAQCIWAGNAKVKIAVTKGTMKTPILELNSTSDPRSAEYGGYEFTFVSLTEKPNKPGQMMMVRPKLVLKVTRLKR